MGVLHGIAGTLLNKRETRNYAVLFLLTFCLSMYIYLGPGGLLGVLPAVEMKNWSAASIYLLCFVVSSTLCMGIFAAMYGEMTKKLGDMNGFVEFFVNMFSCSLSLIVGILWVVLSCMGKLEEFFEE